MALLSGVLGSLILSGVLGSLILSGVPGSLILSAAPGEENVMVTSWALKSDSWVQLQATSLPIISLCLSFPDCKRLSFVQFCEN